MRERVSMSLGALVPIVVAAAVAGAAPAPAKVAAPPVRGAESRLLSSTAPLASPPPGALLQQFLANQGENCSLICPFVVQGAVQIPLSVVAAPQTLFTQVLAGRPLVQAVAATAAGVSGAANDAWTGIIVTDLDQVIPRARYGTEVVAVGLVDIAESAAARPGQLPQAVAAARTDLFDALSKQPGATSPAAAHDAVGAAAVRVLEVGWAVAFQGPERFLLGFTQAPNAFLTTLAATGDIATALKATGSSVSTTIAQSIAPVRKALTEPIPITPKAAATNPGAVKPDVAKARTPVSAHGKVPARRSTEMTMSKTSEPSATRPSAKAGPARRASGSAGDTKPPASAHPADQTAKQATGAPGGFHRRAAQGAAQGPGAAKPSLRK